MFVHVSPFRMIREETVSPVQGQVCRYFWPVHKKQFFPASDCDNCVVPVPTGRRLELDGGRLVPVDAADEPLVLPGHRLELVRDLGRHRDVDAVALRVHQVRRLNEWRGGRGFSAAVRFKAPPSAILTGIEKWQIGSK